MNLPNPLESTAIRSKSVAGVGTNSHTSYMHALVKSVDGTNAWVVDQLGKMRKLSTTRVFGKGLPPKVGETWLITSIFGDWMFAVCINPVQLAYTSEATPDTLVYRSDAGTAQIADPVDDADIANKGYVTSAIINGGTTPNPPAAITLNSSLYLTSQNNYRLKAHLSWTPPTTNTDGSPVTDLHHYELAWQYTDMTTDTDWHVIPNVPVDAIDEYGLHGTTWLGVERGHHVNVQIRAVDRYQNRSTYVTASGALNGAYGPPPMPSTPVLDTYLGFHRAYWDGNNSDGSAVPIDFDHIEVHWSTTAGFTPSAATLVSTMTTAGYYTHKGNYSITGYFAFLEVDESGNKGPASAQAGNTPVKVTNNDINDVSTDKVTDGTLTSTVTLEGTICAGDPNAQNVTIDGTGIQAFDASGNQSLKISSIDGSISLPEGGTISNASFSGGSIGSTNISASELFDCDLIVDATGGSILVYAAGAPVNVALTTASSSPWTVPAGVTSVKVQCWGAGGGSQQGYSSAFAAWSGASGGGGEYAGENNYPVTSGASIPFVVGSGSAGVTSGNKALAGGNTTFNVGAPNPVIAHGGLGGGQYSNSLNPPYGGGGTGGTGSSNSTHFDGGDGVDVYTTGNAANVPIGGNGGGGAASAAGSGRNGRRGTHGTGASGGAGGAGTGLGGNGGSGGSPTSSGAGGSAFGGGAGSGGAPATLGPGGGGNSGADGHIIITYYTSLTLIASISSSSGTDTNGINYPAGARFKNVAANGGVLGGYYSHSLIGTSGAGQSIATATTTLFNFFSAHTYSDYGAAWGTSTFVVPETGVYSFYLWCDNVIDGATNSSIIIRQNGNAIGRNVVGGSSGAGSNTGMGTSAANIWCTAGDFFTFAVYQNSGAAKTITGFATIKKES